jgi:undecaprenyl diphosphate synthase
LVVVAPSSTLHAHPGDAPLLPRHIAIIMDGNGRWAKQHGKLRSSGHRAGAEALRKLIEGLQTRPYVKYLTVYAFSEENWKRDPSEVDDLMGLLRHYIRQEASSLIEKGIRLRFIGNRHALSAELQRDIQEIEHASAANDTLTLVVALSYGARQEMVMAARTLALRVARAEISPDAIDEALVAETLYSHHLPDPDLMIRTGGEQRLSNFLLWQSAYSELYFCDTLWPDFDVAALDVAIDAYTKRERRFGARMADAS